MKPLTVLELICITVLSVVDTQGVRVQLGYLGHDVTLQCPFVKGAKIVQVQWKLQQPEGQSIPIIVYNPQLGVNISQSHLKEKVKVTEQSLVIKDVELDNAGLYTCHVTTFPSGSFQDTIKLIVHEQMPLSSGIVFAIVVAVLLLLGIIAAVAYFIFTRTCDLSVRHHGLIDTGGTETNMTSPSALARNEDVVYADVKFKSSRKEMPSNHDKHINTINSDVTYADVVLLNHQPKNTLEAAVYL